MIKLKISFAPNGKNKENDELFSSYFFSVKNPLFLSCLFFFKDQKTDVRTYRYVIYNTPKILNRYIRTYVYNINQ